MTPQTGYSYEQVLAALKKTEGESRRQLFLEVGDIGSVSGQQQQTNANLDVLPRRLPCKIAVYLRHYRDIRRYHADELNDALDIRMRYHADELNDALEMLSYEFRMLVSREQLALIRRTTHATVIEEALRPDDMPGEPGEWPTGPVDDKGRFRGADHWKKAKKALADDYGEIASEYGQHDAEYLLPGGTLSRDHGEHERPRHSQADRTPVRRRDARVLETGQKPLGMHRRTGVRRGTPGTVVPGVKTQDER